MAQVMVSITRGRLQPVQPPTHELQNILTPREYTMAMERQKISLIGSENTVQQKFKILWKLMVKSTKLWL